ncbi:MAG: diheme cytochrome c [Deltaproteobacteria bacterium]|nr:diheme cytochrome c [Deltaproteobacteria bacterium]
MRKTTKWMVFLVAFLLMLSGPLYKTLADHDGHQEKRQYQKGQRDHSGQNGRRDLSPVNDSTYRANCGACHFAYQPELLPSVSWNAILSKLEDHFGETIDLSPESKSAIAGYLKANAAERSSAKLVRKIVRSIGKQVPLRITEIPYIQHKHHRIPRDVFQRESAGSFSNCLYCHRSADQGIYEDDSGVIPR